MNANLRIKVPINILNQYRKEVKGNENITLQEAEMKFARNMQLSDQYETKDGMKKKYCVYGSLHFIVDRHGTVVYMKNWNSKGKWKQKEYLKKHLSRMLKIS